MLFTYKEIEGFKLYTETFSLINNIFTRLNNTSISKDFEFLFDENEDINSFFADLKIGFKYLYDLIYKNNTDLHDHEIAIEHLNVSLRNIQIGIESKTEYVLFASLLDALLKYFNEVFITLDFYRVFSDPVSNDEQVLISVVNKVINTWADKGKANRLREKEIYKKRFSELEKKLLNLKEQIEKFETVQSKSIENFLNDARKKVSDEVLDSSRNYQLQVDNFFNKIDQEIIDKVEELKSKLNNTEVELENLGVGVKSYNSIVSEKVENEFSKYYLSKAKEEKKIYYGITIFSIILLVVSIVFAWFSLTKYYNNYVDPQGLKNTIKGLNPLEIEWVQQAAFLYLSLRLVISILIFLSVIYTGRIAYRAYLHWRHSENTHLKLASLRPFINDLPIDDITQIRKNLIPDFFGKDAGNIDSNNESFKDLPSNVSALAAKAIEQVGNNIGTKSTTEKNDKKSESGTE
ncbi:hypothetical protein Q5X60_07845 [Acinetobacter baumannii]|uniref:hypothetical protein n=1 Tax=Acinetobacter baumannii TaxID=470 RepID=UPI00233FB041|nr:hypothetical protein [Acinetobacter baumannii]MDC4915739.1 hypothetical protein [Acinetobacter baumannii]MDO7468708.1 hypothetical protein [Acinetobacter baumannii]